MMAILFLIGKGFEDIDLITTMLDPKFIETTKLNYEIASDAPLILTDCQHEGVEFSNKVENLCETFIDLRNAMEKSIIEACITSRMMDSIIPNIIKESKEEGQGLFSEDLEGFIKTKVRKTKGNYTKLLSIKRNKRVQSLKD